MDEDRDHVEAGFGLGPTDDEDDAGEALESFLLERDHAGSESDQVTAGGGRRGASLDERLGQEQRQGEPTPVRTPLLADHAGTDDEPAMVSDEPHRSASSDGDLSAEEAAVHVRSDAPGWTDHPDDYVEPGPV